jgi:nitrogen fixation NifU-like protein
MDRFSQTLMDHFQDPRNRGEMREPDAVGAGNLQGSPPFVTVYLQFDGTRIASAMFEAAGCGVTIACASCLTELIVGLTRDECTLITAQGLAQALDGIPPDKEYCADVVIDALRQAIRDGCVGTDAGSSTQTPT